MKSASTTRRHRFLGAQSDMGFGAISSAQKTVVPDNPFDPLADDIRQRRPKRPAAHRKSICTAWPIRWRPK
jgi:hypothetical protein